MAPRADHPIPVPRPDEPWFGGRGLDGTASFFEASGYPAAKAVAGTRVAVEPRHDSWWTEGIRALLERRGAALCWADRGSRPVTPLWRTADWGYLRFHGGRAEPWPRYGSGLTVG